MESAILSDPLFEQALIVGEGKPYLSALLILNSDKWFSLAHQLQLDPMEKHSLDDKTLHQYIIQRVRQLLHDFPAYAKIRRVSLKLDAWTIENGLLTPTMKIKRAKIVERYQDDIVRLYASCE